MGTFKQMLIGMLPFLLANKANQANQQLNDSYPLTPLGYDNLPLVGIWHQSPIYFPKRGKLKGYQKENKRMKYRQ